MVVLKYELILLVHFGSPPVVCEWGYTLPLNERDMYIILIRPRIIICLLGGGIHYRCDLGDDGCELGKAPRVTTKFDLEGVHGASVVPSGDTSDRGDRSRDLIGGEESHNSNHREPSVVLRRKREREREKTVLVS